MRCRGDDPNVDDDDKSGRYRGGDGSIPWDRELVPWEGRGYIFLMTSDTRIKHLDPECSYDLTYTQDAYIGRQRCHYEWALLIWEKRVRAHVAAFKDDLK